MTEVSEETGDATHTDQSTTATTGSPTVIYTPQIVCPHVIALEPTFTVEDRGIDAGTQTGRVELVMTYPNPVDYPLYLTGSLGYVDGEGYEADLYSTDPGDLIFDDERLDPGPGTITRVLEDVWGESLESDVYFTSWLMTGAELDSGTQPQCEENRGYTDH